MDRTTNEERNGICVFHLPIMAMNGYGGNASMCLVELMSGKIYFISRQPVRTVVTRYHLKRLGKQAKVASTFNKAVSLCGKNGFSTTW